MYPKGKPYPRSSYDENGLKICSDCKNHKEKNLFPSNIGTYDKISNICKDCTNKRSREYFLKNKEKESIRRKNKYLKYKQKEIEASNVYKSKKYHNNNSFRILTNIRNRHRIAVKSAGIEKKFKTTLLLGCNAEYLKKYIEIQFKDDMNWSNYGILWNIDHIYPLSKVDWNCIYDTAKYCHYSNLQPLYKIDNIIKGNKIKYKN